MIEVRLIHQVIVILREKVRAANQSKAISIPAIKKTLKPQ
jgi:hypothetical protein